MNAPPISKRIPFDVRDPHIHIHVEIARFHGFTVQDLMARIGQFEPIDKTSETETANEMEAHHIGHIACMRELRDGGEALIPDRFEKIPLII